jgi:hypothetical protein
VNVDSTAKNTRKRPLLRFMGAKDRADFERGMAKTGNSAAVERHPHRHHSEF